MSPRTIIVPTSVGEVAVDRSGDGPSVVLLHATLHDRHDFDSLVPLLPGYDVIRIDWPHHGESAAVGSPPTAVDLARSLRECLAHLGIERPVIVGNSVGGFAAAQLALADPAKVMGLVLVNTSLLALTGRERWFARVMSSPLAAGLILRGLVRQYVRPRTPPISRSRDG